MVQFIQETHQYFTENGRELKSITKLLKQHRLSPDYDGIDEEVMKAASSRGTLIHQELSEWIKNKTDGFTKELEAFQQFVKDKGVKEMESEIIVYNELFAGTVDLTFKIEDCSYLIDFKTGSTINQDYCAWQLSCYENLSGKKFDKLGVFHFVGDKLKFVDLTPFRKPTAEIEKLFQLDAIKNLYTAPKTELPTVAVELAKITEAEKIIKKIKSDLEDAEARSAQLKEVLMKAMLDSGVKSFENDNIKLTYVGESIRESIDSKKLKDEMPDIAKKYTKISLVKPTLRITLKGDK